MPGATQSPRWPQPPGQSGLHLTRPFLDQTSSKPGQHFSFVTMACTCVVLHFVSVIVSYCKYSSYVTGNIKLLSNFPGCRLGGHRLRWNNRGNVLTSLHSAGKTLELVSTPAGSRDRSHCPRQLAGGGGAGATYLWLLSDLSHHYYY